MSEGKDISPFKSASERWQAVIREYATNGFVKTAAYRKVYTDASEDSVQTAAPRLFGKVRFRAALDDYLSRQCMGKPEALMRLADQTRSDNEGIAQGALDKILKAGGAYVTRTEHSGPDGGPMRLWQIVDAEGGDAVQ